MSSARIAFLILLISVVAGIGQAQEKSSTSTPAKKAAPSSSRVVLKVGGVQVTEAEFESMIGDIEPQGEADADKPGMEEKDRRRLGDDYASVLMLSQQALNNHLDATPEIRRKLAVQRLQILSDAQFASLLRQSMASKEEISQYYSAHPADYDRVTLRRLFIWKMGTGSSNTKGMAADAAKARANAILQASSADDAEKLAAAFKGSEEGMLDAEPIPFIRGALPAQMEKVAFAMKPGEWAEGVETADNVILLHLIKRDRRPLAEVSSIIEQRVQGQKMQARLDELKKNAGIWMDEKYFGDAEAVAPAKQRPVSEAPSTREKQTEKRGENQ